MDGDKTTTVDTIDARLLADAEREVRKLQVRLTDEERRARLEDVARLTGVGDDLALRVEQVKESAKAAVKAAEGELATTRARATELARYARAGEEPRDVEVHIAIDRAKRERLVVRGDTGAVVERRAAHTDEVEAGCDWVQDLEKGVAHLTHAPTGVVVRTRILTAEERQLTIDATAPRELVWIGAGVWAQLTADEVEALECPVPKGTRVKWIAAGDAWMHVSAPKGPTLDGLMHQLARLDIAFKVGNDAPKTIGDLARRRDADRGKVASVKGGRRASKGEQGDEG